MLHGYPRQRRRIGSFSATAALFVDIVGALPGIAWADPGSVPPMTKAANRHKLSISPVLKSDISILFHFEVKNDISMVHT